MSDIEMQCVLDILSGVFVRARARPHPTCRGPLLKPADGHLPITITLRN